MKALRSVIGSMSYDLNKNNRYNLYNTIDRKSGSAGMPRPISKSFPIYGALAKYLKIIKVLYEYYVTPFRRINSSPEEICS